MYPLHRSHPLCGVCAASVKRRATRGDTRWNNGGVTDTTEPGFTGEATETFTDGRLAASGPYLNGRKNGEWTSLNRKGNVRGRGMFVDGEMDGSWEWFREDGSRMRSGHFTRGEQTGEWITWDAQGNAVTVKNFS